MFAKRIPPLLLVMLCGTMVLSARAQLGLTVEAWRAKFGQPDSRDVYRWRGPESKVEFGPYLIKIQVEENRVTGIQVRRASGKQFLPETARFVIADLRLSDKDLILLKDALSEDRLMLTLQMPEEPEPFAHPGGEAAMKGSVLMGKYTNDWVKTLGKPDEKGFYLSGAYRLQPATNKNSGKVDWIKVMKVSGDAFTDQEIGTLYKSLTGRRPSGVSNPPKLFQENTLLLMTKPKKK